MGSKLAISGGKATHLTGLIQLSSQCINEAYVFLRRNRVMVFTFRRTTFVKRTHSVRQIPGNAQFDNCKLSSTGGVNVAQLEERQTGEPPTQVRFPGAARDFVLLV